MLYNLRSILVIISVALFISCEKEPIDQEPVTVHTGNQQTIQDEFPEGHTALYIRLTDAATDLQEVNIDLQGLEVSADGEVFSIPTATGIYNLLDFQDGIDTLISADTITFNYIKEVRFLLGENNSVLTNDGEVFPLNLPGQNIDLLRIKVNMDLDSLSILDLQLDFDACKSVVETGNGWMLKPVIHISKINGEEQEEEEEEEEDNNDDDDDEDNEDDDDDDNDDDDNDDDDDINFEELEGLLANYPGFDISGIEKEILCFMDSLLVYELELEGSDNQELELVIDTNYQVLFEITELPFDSLDEIFGEVIASEMNGNYDIDTDVDVYGSSEGTIYNIEAERGNGNGNDVEFYFTTDGSLICMD